MVHGNPTWSFLYRDVIRALRADFRCVAVDLPGFGLSPAPAGYGFEPSEHAGVLAALVAELDLAGYVLMGQDWGGPIGLAAAGRAPDRVAGLALGNTWAWSMSGRPDARLWSFSFGGVPGRFAVEQLNLFTRLAVRGGVRRKPLTPAERRHYEAPFPTPASRRPTWVLARAVAGSRPFFEEQVEPALRELADRPAVLPWGDKDPVLGEDACERLAGRLRDARVVRLAGAGHFIQEDAPQELAAAVRGRFAG
jgi:haloalkane dehalogenase